MANSIAILGGGISGLSTAYYLLKNSIKHGINISKIYVIEEQSRFGGWLQTIQIQNNLNKHFELGPRTISTNSYAGTNVISLVDEIGLANDINVVTKKSKSFNKRYVVIDNKLRKLPNKLLELLKYQEPFKPFIYYLVKDIWTPPVYLPQSGDISVHEFFKYRFGNEIADYLVASLCIGITGGDSTTLSMKSLFPNLFRKEQLYGSVVKSMLRKEDIFQDFIENDLVQKSIEQKWAVFSFKNGIETLPIKLCDHLRQNYQTRISLMDQTKVTSLKFDNNKVYIEAEQEDQKMKLDVDYVFSSLPAFKLATTLSDNQAKLKNALSSIISVHMAVVCIDYDKQILSPDFAFGFLVPPKENSPILGVTFDSCIFASSSPQSTMLTVMLGGFRFLDLFGHPDSVNPNDLLSISLAALKTYLKIDLKPKNYHVAIHKNCIPQYTMGHDSRLKIIENEMLNLNLSLVGSSYYGFSVPDCILNGKIQADKWIKKQMDLLK